MSELNILIRKSLSVYFEHIGPLAKVLWPYILIYSLVSVGTVYLEITSIPITVLISFAEMIVGGFFVFAAINIIAGDQPLTGVSGTTLLSYIVATFYVFVAAALGMFLFIIPGLFILASTFLYPLLILKHREGPIEAISNSVSFTAGYTLNIFAIFFILWLLAFVSEWLVSFLFDIHVAVDILISVIYLVVYTLASLYLSVLMLNIYSQSLEKNDNSGQQEADDVTYT